MQALTQNDFDGSKIVFLPPEDKISPSPFQIKPPPKFSIQNSAIKPWTLKSKLPNRRSSSSRKLIITTGARMWTASQTPLLRANHAFQAIQVPAGRHKIHLAYEDRAFEIGAAVSIVAWLGCLICLFRLPRRKIQ